MMSVYKLFFDNHRRRLFLFGFISVILLLVPGTFQPASAQSSPYGNFLYLPFFRVIPLPPLIPSSACILKAPSITAPGCRKRFREAVIGSVSMPSIGTGSNRY